MGQYVITIMGTGCHHNFKTETRDDGVMGRGSNYLIPDGKGGWQRTNEGDADALAAEFVELLKKHGHYIEHASFTSGGRDMLLKPEVEPEPPAPVA